MKTYSGAMEIIQELAKARRSSTEFVSLPDSTGRVLAETVSSDEALPSFDNSAMDGFAVRARETRGASPETPIRLGMAGSLAAGDGIEESFARPRQAVEIMTGAPMPVGDFDAVVKVEDTRPILDATGKMVEVEILKPSQASENVRFTGQDFKAGATVLLSGTRILPQHLISLAALGVDRVKVWRKPRVAVIATGSELVDHSVRKPAPGLIRNSTTPFLLAALTECGATARFYGIIRDEPERFRKLLEEVLRESPDAIITTGAVSMGKHDFVRSAIEELGARTVFHKVAIRPGKPLLLSEFSIEQSHKPGPVLFGIPGNPVSTAVGFRFFVLPFLHAQMGLPPERGFMAPLRGSLRKPAGLRCFFKGRYVIKDGAVEVSALTGQASFMTQPLLQANCWVIFDESGSEVPSGTSVRVQPMLPEAESGAWLS